MTAGTSIHPAALAEPIVLCTRLMAHHTSGRTTIVETLERLGQRVNVIQDGPWDPSLGRVLIVNGTIQWFPRLRRQLLREGKPPGTTLVVWHTEPLPPPRSSGLRWPIPYPRELAKILLRDRRATDVYTNYFRLRQLHRSGLPDILCVSTRGRVDFLAERGIHAEYVPHGYGPDLGRDLGMERDIDVLFLGETKVLRRRLALLYLQWRGVEVLCRGGWSDLSCWGEARTELLNRTKIFLNVQRFAGEYSGLRFALAAANRAFVISEPMYDSYPFVAGEHYVAATLREMPEAIRHYLVHEEERRRIAENAFACAVEKHDRDAALGHMLRLVRDRVQQA